MMRDCDAIALRLTGMREHGLRLAEVDEVRATSETWRESCLAWSEWAAAVLREHGIQLEGCEWGDGPAREKIAALTNGRTACLPVSCETCADGQANGMRCQGVLATRSDEEIVFPCPSYVERP